MQNMGVAINATFFFGILGLLILLLILLAWPAEREAPAPLPPDALRAAAPYWARLPEDVPAAPIAPAAPAASKADNAKPAPPAGRSFEGVEIVGGEAFTDKVRRALANMQLRSQTGWQAARRLCRIREVAEIAPSPEGVPVDAEQLGDCEMIVIDRASPWPLRQDGTASTLDLILLAAHEGAHVACGREGADHSNGCVSRVEAATAREMGYPERAEAIEEHARRVYGAKI
jgi:hypothetical protein